MKHIRQYVSINFIDGRVEHYHHKSPNWNSEWTLCTHCTMGIGEKDGIFIDC